MRFWINSPKLDMFLDRLYTNSFLFYLPKTSCRSALALHSGHGPIHAQAQCAPRSNLCCRQYFYSRLLYWVLGGCAFHVPLRPYHLFVHGFSNVSRLLRWLIKNPYVFQSGHSTYMSEYDQPNSSHYIKYLFLFASEGSGWMYGILARPSNFSRESMACGSCEFNKSSLRPHEVNMPLQEPLGFLVGDQQTAVDDLRPTVKLKECFCNMSPSSDHGPTNMLWPLTKEFFALTMELQLLTIREGN